MDCINLGNYYFPNYLLRFEQGYILIDAGNKTKYDAFVKKLNANNVSIKDIKYVVLTHVHDDHVSYLADLLQYNPDIQVICHRKAVERLAYDHMVIGVCTSPLIRFSSDLMERLNMYAPYPTTIVEKAIYAEDDLDYLVKQGYPCRLTLLPGHTQESIGLVVEDKYYFVGDAMFNAPPAKHLIPLVMEDLDAFRASFRAIIDSPADTLYFGHGNPMAREKAATCLPYLDQIRLYTKHVNRTK